jgi:putative membrane protein
VWAAIVGDGGAIDGLLEYDDMQGVLIRFAITALGLWLADLALDGVDIDGGIALVFSALVLGLVNAVVRPVLLILTLPLTIVTLGLFLLVLNALMLSIAGGLVPGFYIADFGSAFLAWIIVSLTSWLASSLIGPAGDIEVIVVRRRH